MNVAPYMSEGKPRALQAREVWLSRRERHLIMDNAVTTSPLALLFQMMNQYRLPQAIFVAARLGIADVLADGPKSAAEVAQATGTHRPTLDHLLRLLGSNEVLREEADGRFGLTALSSYLRSDTPDSWRDWVISLGNTTYPVWGDLLYTVQTGKAAFEHIFGSPYYDYMAQHPEDAAAWDRAMDSSSRDLLATLPQRYDFTPLHRLVDVGGGHGTVLAALLKATPTLSGVVFDLPHVVAGARPMLEAAGVTGRCEIAAGDMFTTVPTGGDAYLLARVLWNWDDERAGIIVRNCQRAMQSEGRLLVFELVLPDGPRPAMSAFSELNLLLEFGGRLRSEGEFRALLETAGFRVMRMVREPETLFALIEARPVASLTQGQGDQAGVIATSEPA
jgi:hypothetical protein